MIYILGPKDKRRSDAINTTSTSKTWSRGLSPFLLGPVKLYGKYVAQNVENGWQNSKCYACHLDSEGNPSPEYFKWAEAGWNSYKANRYPMGKGAIPEYSWWDGKKLNYISARKKIYIPLYASAVLKSSAYKTLKNIYESEKNIYLWDFDGYNHDELNMSLLDVINCDYRKMGHAFVLKMLLTNDKCLEVIGFKNRIGGPEEGRPKTIPTECKVCNATGLSPDKTSICKICIGIGYCLDNE